MWYWIWMWICHVSQMIRMYQKAVLEWCNFTFTDSSYSFCMNKKNMQVKLTKSIFTFKAYHSGHFSYFNSILIVFHVSWTLLLFLFSCFPVDQLFPGECYLQSFCERQTDGDDFNEIKSKQEKMENWELRDCSQTHTTLGAASLINNRMCNLQIWLSEHSLLSEMSEEPPWPHRGSNLH